MFKIGDRIRIKKIYYNYPWYSENTFTIIDINLKNKYVILDKKTSINWVDTINFDYIIHAYIYERQDKILKIKERCLKKVMK